MSESSVDPWAALFPNFGKPQVKRLAAMYGRASAEGEYAELADVEKRREDRQTKQAILAVQEAVSPVLDPGQVIRVPTWWE